MTDSETRDQAATQQREPRATTHRHYGPPGPICNANGWGPGTFLAGDEGYGVTIIQILYVKGNDLFARAVAHKGHAVGGDANNWVLWCRDWREVEADAVPQPIPEGSTVLAQFGECSVESGPDYGGMYVVTNGRKRWRLHGERLQLIVSDGPGFRIDCDECRRVTVQENDNEPTPCPRHSGSTGGSDE